MKNQRVIAELCNMSIDDIYQILRREILSLELPPMTKISENALANRFNVSRTPIRHVMQLLKTEGLLTVVPKSGSFVKGINLDIAEQIIYMRIQIECSVLKYITSHPNIMLLDKLENNLLEQKALLKKDIDQDEFYRLDSKFHELCMAAVGRKPLWNVIENMDVHYVRYRHLDYIDSYHFDTIYLEHKELFECIKSGMANNISKLITLHLYGGFLRIDKRLITEYSEFFIESNRTIEEIILDVKLQLNEK